MTNYHPDQTGIQNIRTLLVKNEEPIVTKLSRHCVATIIVEDQAKLYDVGGFAGHTLKVLERESVQCIGQVSHEFHNKSFTSLFALAESHISVHTWPERFSVQLDVFLCNYTHDNTEKCENIFESIIDYFGPIKEIERTYIDRI